MNGKITVLMAHNRYRERGGEDAAFEADAELLRERGHTVVVHQVSNERLHEMNPVQALLQTIWSRENARAVTALIRRHEPRIVHVHNNFPLLSPSVYHAAARRGVPVVQTLHNYRLLCPNALFLRNGLVCERCSGRLFPWPSLRDACYRGSRTATAAAALMLGLHRLRGTWTKQVNRYVAVSEFARQKHIAGGIPADKIVVRPNFISRDPGVNEGAREGGLFAGMLLPWKGVDVLLSAWSRCPDAGSLRIVGSGPREPVLRRAAGSDPRVTFSGFLREDGVYAEMRKALFLVFPSIWYETFGRTIIEAFACGAPVIASRLGSAAELVRDGETGLHFRAGDADDLARKIRWALAHPDAMRRMGRSARKEYEKRYTAGAAYARLMDIYRDVLPAGNHMQR